MCKFKSLAICYILCVATKVKFNCIIKMLSNIIGLWLNTKYKVISSQVHYFKIVLFCPKQHYEFENSYKFEAALLSIMI
jgi:hypothetical protein